MVSLDTVNVSPSEDSQVGVVTLPSVVVAIMAAVHGLVKFLSCILLSQLS